MSDRDFGNLQWRESSANAESMAATAAAAPGFARTDVDEAEGESGDSCRCDESLWSDVRPACHTYNWSCDEQRLWCNRVRRLPVVNGATPLTQHAPTPTTAHRGNLRNDR